MHVFNIFHVYFLLLADFRRKNMKTKQIEISEKKLKDMKLDDFED